MIVLRMAAYSLQYPQRSSLDESSFLLHYLHDGVHAYHLFPTQRRRRATLVEIKHFLLGVTYLFTTQHVDSPRSVSLRRIRVGGYLLQNLAPNPNLAADGTLYNLSRKLMRHESGGFQRTKIKSLNFVAVTTLMFSSFEHSGHGADGIYLSFR